MRAILEHHVTSINEKSKRKCVASLLAESGECYFEHQETAEESSKESSWGNGDCFEFYII